MDPAGKVAVVTGGNSGLGEATAARCSRPGRQVVSLDRRRARRQGALLRATSATGTLCRGRRAGIEGRIHILLNCAGIGGLGPIAGPKARRHRGVPHR